MDFFPRDYYMNALNAILDRSGNRLEVRMHVLPALGNRYEGDSYQTNS